MPLNYCPHCGESVVGFSTARFCPSCGGEFSGVARTCPNEATCRWRMSGLNGSGGTWTCAHGVTVTSHPNGWCDCGGCR